MASERKLIAGSVTQSDFESARREVEALSRNYRTARFTAAAAAWHWRLVLARILFRRLCRSGRNMLDGSLGRLGGLFIVVTAGGGALVVIANLFSATMPGYFAAALFGMLAAGLSYLPLSFLPSDQTLESQIDLWQVDVVGMERLYHISQEKAATIANRLATARQKYYAIKSAIESRLHRLLTCRWDMMTGPEFEKFLADVLSEQGFHVQLIGRTGDQGVDLIASRNGQRVAVQAKSYLSQNVGNAAVQEAHAGMTYWGCNRAVVITNSSYTPAARNLADSVGCALIDGAQIRDLIRGRVSV